MQPAPVPRSYAEWHHCITVTCGIPLTLPYVDARIATLADPTDDHTRRFAATWGQGHLAQVRGWFESVRQELAGLA